MAIKTPPIDVAVERQLDDTGAARQTDTSSTSTSALLRKDLLLAKGDLITATAASSPQRLAAGTDGQFLKANSVSSVGLEYGVVSTIAENVALTGDISPTQIVSNQNDYNPTGLSTASTLRLSSDAARDITGLQGGADGRVLFIHNVGSFSITLKDESVSSTAANRFALVSDVVLAADAVSLLQYDSTSSRWRVSGSWSNAPTGTGFVHITSGAQDGAAISLSALLDYIGSAAQGDILYRGASSWSRLPAGTSGQFLKTNGAAADPAWATPSTGTGTAILFFNLNTSSVPASSTRFCTFGWNAFVVDENTLNFYMPTAGTFSKMSIHMHTNQPASGSLVVTLRSNSTNTTLTKTIAASGVAGGFDTTTSAAAVAAGDYVSVGFVNNATAASGGIASVALLFGF